MIRQLLGRLVGRVIGGVGGHEQQSTGERDPLGPAGERVAAKHLRKTGYRVLGRNLRVPMGEADILALAPDGKTVVLVEVKTRRVGEHVEGSTALDSRVTGFIPPPPEASITSQKRAKLVSIMRHLALANGWADRQVRIDAIAIEWPRDGAPVVRHHEDAVRAGR